METRAQIEKKMAQKEKEKKEESLRMLAQKARQESAGIRNVEGTAPTCLQFGIEVCMVRQVHVSASLLELAHYHNLFCTL